MIHVKDSKLIEQWQQLLLVNPRLVCMVLTFAHKMGIRCMITEIYRTPAMQHAYYPNEPGKVSVHQYWRGCDLSVRGLDLALASRCADEVDREFPYDHNRPSMRSVIIHDVGHGNHIHFQTAATV